MSFGNKHLDESFDRFITQTPEEYFHTPEDDDENEKEFVCCICKKEGLGFGNNPSPLMQDTDKSPNRCCDKCNATKVIPARVRVAIKQFKWKKEEK